MAIAKKSLRWERRKETRPSELTAAALELFVEKGFAATRLDEIAARAGVSKGTLYLYFDSKEELFKAVIRDSLLPALAQGEELVS
ncbi:MAG: TetR/AcrR family transcriptional regulator, partial [Pseudomonadota bacterium]